jgi:hypothetical protein
MLSGTIKIRSKSYPLTWTGEKAEHLAQGYMDTPHIHPYLHVAAQQFARKGVVRANGGKRYNTMYNNGFEYVCVSLLLQGKFVVICSCFIYNLTDFANLKNKGVGKSGNKKEKVLLDDIQVSAEIEQVLASSGHSVEGFRKAMYQQLNGYPSLNKKR